MVPLTLELLILILLLIKSCILRVNLRLLQKPFSTMTKESQLYNQQTNISIRNLLTTNYFPTPYYYQLTTISGPLSDSLQSLQKEEKMTALVKLTYFTAVELPGLCINYVKQYVFLPFF